jgi:serralysin
MCAGCGNPNLVHEATSLQVGVQLGPKPVWSDAQVIEQLDSGSHWSGTNLTFGFLTSASGFPYAEKTGFTEFNVAQKATATLAMKLWDDLISPDFTLASNPQTANVKYANTTTDIDYAHAYYPGLSSASGTVWLNSTYGTNSGTNNLTSPVVGQWGFQTYIHETGHALGLNHPGTYNGGSPTYANDAMYMQDSQQYTIMSYFTAANTGADWVASDGRTYYAQTPMLHDVMVLQDIYGAETTTRLGDTVYGFNSNADVALFDFTQNKHPIVCIYDSGGIDTLDFSGWSYSSVINLTPGSFCDTDMMTDNISIAYSAWIENAIGGAGADTLNGNTLANRLDAGAGSDFLSGGGGYDTFVYKLGYGADTITDFSDDRIDLSGISTIVDFGDVSELTAQVGANTVITFSAGNTLTLQNVTVATLTAANFVFNGVSMPVNLAPTAIVLSGTSVAENAAGAAIGSVSVADPNGDTTFTFTLSDARFQVTGAAGAYQLKLANGTSLDFETESQINLTITAKDAGGLSIEKTFIVSVTDKSGVTITGTSGADTINGTRTVSGQGFVSGENDTVFGGNGNDTISALGGNDTLNGNAGNDVLNGDDGNDILTGGAGTDTYNGGNGNDTFAVSGTNDQADIFNGGAGTDTILVTGSSALTLNGFNATTASVEIWQGNGLGVIGTTSNNTFNFSGLVGVTGLSYVDGGSGNDTIVGSNFADDLRGGTGNDTLTGGEGNDVLTGGAGTDIINAGGGDDRIIMAGTDGQSDTIAGGTGTDTVAVTGTSALTLSGFNAAASSIEVWQGNSQAVMGTTGINTFDFSGLQSVSGLRYVDASSGNDTVIGSAFADDLRGGAGNDLLNGGAGNDTLSGGNDADVLIGGLGKDTLSGGSGADTFRFLSVADTGLGANADVISDFSASQVDKIDLTAIDAVAGTGANDAFAYIGGGAFTGVAGQLRFAGGYLSADLDGDQIPDFQIALTNIATLNASSILL